MTSRHARTRQSLKSAVGLALVALTFVLLPSAPAAADEFDLTNPLIDTFQNILAISFVTYNFTMPVLEAWRQWGMAMMDIYKTQADDALLTALTTQALLQVDKGVHCSTATVDYIIRKLNDDLKYYEGRYPDLARPDYRPTDPDEQRYQEHYKAIKQVLDNDGAEAQRAAQAAKDAVVKLRKVAAKGAYLLSNLNKEGGFLWRTMSDYNKAVSVFETAVLDLKAHSPHKAVRVVATNNSPDLVFFVQIIEPNAQGAMAVRPDTRYPVVLYPKETPGDKQIDPKGVRGPNRMWFPLRPRDGLVFRVATMGQVRDRMKFLQVVGKSTRPDLSSLERGFYYLGYEAHVPNQVAPLVSRWFSLKESYDWQLRGDWAEYTEVSTTSGEDLKALGYRGRPLELHNDRLVWTLPRSAGLAEEYGTGMAIVDGQAEFLKVGPTSTREAQLEESGRGELRVLTETW